MNRLLLLAVLATFCAFTLQAQQAPPTLNYQGRIVVGGTNFNTTGHFKFALVTTTGGVTTIKWSNDGTVGTNVVPQAFLSLPVANGLYSVQLGDTTLQNSNSTPMAAFPGGLFTGNSNLQLRVWFDDSTHGEQQLTPDQPLASAAFALSAQGVAAGAIGTAQIAAGAVTSAQLASGAVDNTRLATPYVTLSPGAGLGVDTNKVSLGGTVNLTNTGVLSLTGGGGITVSGATGSITLGSTAASANTASAIVARDSSGNFSAGAITLAGNLSLPATASATVGVVNLGGARFLHAPGSHNTFAGQYAGNLAISGNYNSGLGSFSLFSLTSGTNNTGAGDQALFACTTGSNNTAFGQASLAATTSGIDNTAVGSSALNANIGSYNSALGFESLSSNTTGANNTGMGFQALQSNLTGGDNTAAGFLALSSNTGGSANTASGSSALTANTTAGLNVAIGNGALATQSFGNGGVAWSSNNVAVGFQALYSNQPTSTSNGFNNTAVGTGALYANTTASYNAALGASALTANTTGDYNTAVGYAALTANTTGSANVAIGEGALVALPGGGNNTAVGESALDALTSGNNNVAVGPFAGGNLKTGSGNIYLATAGTASESNTMRLGSPGSTTTTIIGGVRGITTGSNNTQTVLIDINGQLGTISSSRRYKEDIADMGDASARLRALRPVTFRYKKPYDNGQKPIQFGLIAEEVAAVFPELAVFNAEGQPESVKYQDLTPMLLNEVQKLEGERERLQRECATLRAAVEQLKTADQEREGRIIRLERLIETRAGADRPQEK